MPELYACGSNRIIYKTQNFTTGITVTAYFWNPSLVKSALQTFTEIELGLYYIDYDFIQPGTYAALFYENGVEKIPGTFRVTELALASITAAIKAKTDNLPSGLQKNVALSNFSFLMTDSTDNTPKTGLTVTVQISKDGGVFTDATNTPATEIGNGAYKINVTQAERNADIAMLKATAPGANQTTLVLLSSM